MLTSFLTASPCSCVYKRGFDNATRRNTKQNIPILDIEELVETMKEKEVHCGTLPLRACWNEY